jgi:hypothetical protein
MYGVINEYGYKIQFIINYLSMVQYISCMHFMKSNGCVSGCIYHMIVMHTFQILQNINIFNIIGVQYAM